MKLRVALSVVPLLVASTLIAVPRGAEGVNAVPVSGSIMVVDENHGTDPVNGYHLCAFSAFIQFAAVSGVVSYHAEIDDNAVGHRVFSGPPFADTDPSGYTHAKAPEGLHRFFLTGGAGEGPDPCHPGNVTGRFTHLVITGQRTNAKPPIAAFTVSPLPTAGAYRFTSTSTDPQGEAVTLSWAFGDGHAGDSAVVSHEYAHAGTYRVVLTATNTSGLSATANARVVVAASGLTVTVGFEQHGRPLPEGTVTLAEDSSEIAPQDVTAVVMVINGTRTGQQHLSFNGTPPLSFHDPAAARVPFPASVTAGPLPPGPLPDLPAGQSLTRSFHVHVTADGVLDFSPQVLSTDKGTGVTRTSAGTGTFTANLQALEVDWKMPPRVAESLDNLSESPATRGLPPAEFVSPASWKVSLLLRDRSGKEVNCRTGVSYLWAVTAPDGATVVEEPAPGCSTTMTVSRLGNYAVTATRATLTAGVLHPTRALPLHGDVKVDDLLVVGMGDSNASGEGKGPFYFQGCDRGKASYQYQTAVALEHKMREHTSVTFVSPACSGARTQHMVNVAYDGIDNKTLQRPQIRAVKTLLATHPHGPARNVSAVLTSIGINNIGFGPLLKYCVIYGTVVGEKPCNETPVFRNDDGTGGVASFRRSVLGDPTLDRQVRGLIGELPARYNEVASALRGFVDPSKVYLSQYPTEVYDDAGQVCSFGLHSNFTHPVWSWLLETGDSLNRAVMRGANAHGWHTIVVPDKAFSGHGYCAHDSWFVGLTFAKTHGVDDGAFHATARGAQVTADIAVADLCPAIAPDKRDCTRAP